MDVTVFDMFDLSDYDYLAISRGGVYGNVITASTSAQGVFKLRNQQVMVKAASPIKDVPDLAGKRVATAKGSSMEVNIRKAVPTVNVISFDTSPQALVAMQQGKAVAFVNEDQSLARALVEMGSQRKDYRLLPTSISTESLALGIKKGESGLKKAVDDTLRELEANGKAQALYEQYFGSKSALKMGARRFKMDSDQITE